MQETLNILAGVLFIIGFVPYGLSICKGETKPTKATWIIWYFLDLILFVGMWLEGTLNGQIIGVVAGVTVILTLTLYFGEPGWSRLDKICLALATIGIGLWIILGDPILGMTLSMIAGFIGAIPTFKSAWEDPSRENRLSWAIFWVSCVCAVLAIPAWTFMDMAQPLIFLTIESIMVYLLFLRKRPVKLQAVA